MNNRFILNKMSFSPQKAKEKLQTLSNNQQSIQSTSQWCLFHTKHAKDIVSAWNSLFSSSNSTPEYRLALLYLCNDILQLARPKMERHALFFTSFKTVLPSIMGNVSSSRGDNISKYSRVLDVWKQRHVYDEGTIRVFKTSLESTSNEQQATTSSKSSSAAKTHNNIGVSDELKPIVEKHTQLDTLTKNFKTNYSKFHTSCSVVLKSDVESDIPQLLTLGKQLEAESQTVVELRTSLAGELRKLAAELDDWQMLDQQKLQNVKSNVKQLQTKMDAIEAAKVQQAVLDEEDDDMIPGYDDDEDEKPESGSGDDDDKQNEGSGGDKKRQKTSDGQSQPVDANSALQSLNSILEQLS